MEAAAEASDEEETGAADAALVEEVKVVFWILILARKAFSF